MPCIDSREVQHKLWTIFIFQIHRALQTNLGSIKKKKLPFLNVQMGTPFQQKRTQG